MELVAPAITAAVCYPASLLPGAFVVYFVIFFCSANQLACPVDVSVMSSASGRPATLSVRAD